MSAMVGVGAAAILTIAMMGWPTIFLVVAMFASYAIWVRRSQWPAPEDVVRVYALAIFIQGLHLIEEYTTRFYAEFPAVFGAQSWSPLRFLIFNFVWLAVFVIAGVGLASGNRLAYLVALFLAIGGGIANGIGHLALSARRGGYFPGAYTGVLSLLVGSVLAFRLLRPTSRAH